MGRDSGTGSSQRMAQCDRATLAVELFPVDAQLPLDGACLRSERFVHFDEIDVVELQARRCERLPRGRNRSDSHDLGIDTGNAPRHELSERLKSTL